MHAGFRMLSVSIAVKNIMGNLIEIALNLQIAFNRMVTSIVSILSIYEHEMLSHVFSIFLRFLNLFGAFIREVFYLLC